MKSKGLGDSIEKFTQFIGIKTFVESMPNGCDCDHRKNWLNKNFPYKK